MLQWNSRRLVPLLVLLVVVALALASGEIASFNYLEW
jgi:hypothetical protein